MGLNKPIKVGGGLTAAEVQTIIDAQTATINSKVDEQTSSIAGKVDAQTSTLKTDLPSSISGGASVSEIKAALDEKLPQYTANGCIKSNTIGYYVAPSAGDHDIALITKINPANAQVTLGKSAGTSTAYLLEVNEYSIKVHLSNSVAVWYQVIEFN